MDISFSSCKKELKARHAEQQNQANSPLAGYKNLWAGKGGSAKASPKIGKENISIFVETNKNNDMPDYNMPMRNLKHENEGQ